MSLLLPTGSQYSPRNLRIIAMTTHLPVNDSGACVKATRWKSEQDGFILKTALCWCRPSCLIHNASIDDRAESNLSAD